MNHADQIIETIQAKLDHLKKTYGVKRLGVFGSCVRGEATSKSDVDVLVEFERSSFDNYMDLKLFLEDLLGRRVDLVLRTSLKPALRDHILREVRDVA